MELLIFMAGFIMGRAVGFVGAATCIVKAKEREVTVANGYSSNVPDYIYYQINRAGTMTVTLRLIGLYM